MDSFRVISDYPTKIDIEVINGIKLDNDWLVQRDKRFMINSIHQKRKNPAQFLASLSSFNQTNEIECSIKNLYLNQKQSFTIACKIEFKSPLFGSRVTHSLSLTSPSDTVPTNFNPFLGVNKDFTAASIDSSFAAEQVRTCGAGLSFRHVRCRYFQAITFSFSKPGTFAITTTYLEFKV